MSSIDDITKNLNELSNILNRELEYNESILNRIGIKTITYIQCIKCGAKFRFEDYNLVMQHIDMFHKNNKIEST